MSSAKTVKEGLSSGMPSQHHLITACLKCWIKGEHPIVNTHATLHDSGLK